MSPTRPLIPYAGRDVPAECSRRIDAARAARLRAAGLKWREVATALSEGMDPWTTMPFTPDGVIKAVLRHRRCRE